MVLGSRMLYAIGLAVALTAQMNAESTTPEPNVLQPLGDDSQTDQILILMEPMMSASVDHMSSEILKGFKNNEDLIPESIEIPSQPEIHEYIWITFAEPTLDSFRPELSEELETGYDEVQQEAQTWKKDKKVFKTKSRKHAMKMLDRIKHRFEKHYTKAYKEWVKFQALHEQLEKEDRAASDAPRETGLNLRVSKRQLELPKTPDVSDRDDMSFREKMIYGFKHGFLSHKKGAAIGWTVVLSMILTLPAFSIAMLPGGYVYFGIWWTAWSSFFVFPILSRILQGYWFWEDDPMA